MTGITIYERRRSYLSGTDRVRAYIVPSEIEAWRLVWRAYRWMRRDGASDAAVWFFTPSGRTVTATAQHIAWGVRQRVPRYARAVSFAAYRAARNTAGRAARKTEALYAYPTAVAPLP